MPVRSLGTYFWARKSIRTRFANDAGRNHSFTWEDAVTKENPGYDPKLTPRKMKSALETMIDLQNEAYLNVATCTKCGRPFQRQFLDTKCPACQSNDLPRILEG